MIFHENRLLADDSHEVSYLIFFLKIEKDIAKFVVCCSCDWRFLILKAITGECNLPESHVVSRINDFACWVNFHAFVVY